MESWSFVKGADRPILSGKSLALTEFDLPVQPIRDCCIMRPMPEVSSFRVIIAGQQSTMVDESGKFSYYGDVSLWFQQLCNSLN